MPVTQIQSYGLANSITLTGNITAGNLIGPVANGNSNVNIPSANGNVTITVAGNANVLTVTGSSIRVAGNITATGTITSNVALVLNDISTQCDGNKTVFPLMIDQTSINTIVDSKDLQVSINGQILAPYITELRYPWLTPYDSYKGFRVVGSNVIIYNAPNYGDQCVMIVQSYSASAQTRSYPYSSSTIAFGD